MNDFDLDKIDAANDEAWAALLAQNVTLPDDVEATAADRLPAALQEVWDACDMAQRDMNEAWDNYEIAKRVTDDYPDDGDAWRAKTKMFSTLVATLTAAEAAWDNYMAVESADRGDCMIVKAYNLARRNKDQAEATHDVAASAAVEAWKTHEKALAAEWSATFADKDDVRSTTDAARLARDKTRATYDAAKRAWLAARATYARFKRIKEAHQCPPK